MRRVFLCALMTALCLLPSGCSTAGSRDKEDELALGIRTQYIAMNACAGQVALTADYGERVYEYVLSFSYEKDNGLTLTVVEPANLAGITAKVEDGSTTLQYDGVVLETGPLSGTGLSPIDALPALLTYAKEGYIAECGMERLGEVSCLRICCRDPNAKLGEGEEGALWFDAGTHDLVRGEISSDGFVVVRCEFQEFSLQ
ncbi:hypothetical protein SDC9_82170 [bioreactor metagenome]|uniref:Lipoprotein n=1 Tax=bioreactor metagenome TaxID=1076179 RepID=A0A644Z4N4_9ZZZZ